LIEHYSGNLPLWLAPNQVMVLNITDDQKEYAKSINDKLLKSGFRSECDFSNEKIGYKIRNHAMTRVPYMIIIGDKELTNNNITARDRTGKDLGSMNLESFIELLENNK